ncbi:hypothetical protein DP113_02715 [Brasilonema octagenarum UFV-E1]|jgi:hypothetical protein|uniref:Uncharacterized protein n=2 Tax=Brasilonema TaxID=383614 RepID=A0A856M9B6_9CYAN|nr:hypothetical protein [Brasilonema octagenarum UFV-OR1]QDL06974.1 hypothetical protein DP114_02760 [Brasilonema sennae CENA114]QDL13337.1 hypothetical protein DP113_02715 [Brasilonema octagenarum UFV-E1]
MYNYRNDFSLPFGSLQYVILLNLLHVLIITQKSSDLRKTQDKRWIKSPQKRVAVFLKKNLMFWLFLLDI